MTATTSKELFESRMLAAKGDPLLLVQIEEELASLRGVKWAIPLRMRAIQMRKAGLAQTAPSSFGLPVAEAGRPLFAYRLTGEQFIELERRVKARKGTFSARVDQAAFVLWASEWFRRCFTGGMQRWADLGHRLGLRQSQAEWRALADGGLAYWGIAPLRLHGATQRLLHLARQGGFPTAAVEDAAGWASRYLEKLVGVLLDIEAPTSDLAFDFAEGLQQILPESWRYQDFYLVSADLALAVVRLRMEAQEDGMVSSLPASFWLDQHKPDWRDELPLVVDSDAARTLIDGLMKVEQIRGGGGKVGVERWIVLIANTWSPRIAFNLNGELPSSEIGFLSGEWSRLRMFATGQMAASVSGELAIVEPDAEDRWLTRPSRSSTLLPLPLSIPVEVELRGGGERVCRVITLGNGAPVRSPLLVLQPPDNDPHPEPQTLRIVGSGSGGYAAEPLYLVAPRTWSMQVESGVGSVQPQQLTEDGRQLWKVSGTVTVVTDEDDVYLIRSGQDRDEKDRLILAGNRLPKADGMEGQEVFVGMPRFFLKEDRRERAAHPGDIWWRPTGSRTWRSDESPLGDCEFVWRNPTTGHIRDRATVVVLPDGFSLGLPGRAGATQLSLAGWPGQCTFAGETGDGAGHSWSIGDWQSIPAEAQVVLRNDSVPPFQLRLRLPKRPGISTWDGQAAHNRKVLALAELHHYLAVAEGRRSLTARLRDKDKRYVKQGERRWTFEDELPLTAIHDDLAAMLRPLGEIDAAVELAIEGSSTIWYVNEFEARLRALADHLVLTAEVNGEELRAKARPLHQANIEDDLGAVEAGANWTGISRHSLPGEGTWLIYLRSAGNVVTRPYLHIGRPLSVQPRTALYAAMVETDHGQRQVAVEHLCDQMETASTIDPCFDEVLSLIENLQGLPPATFDVIAAAFRRPRLAVRILFRANAKQYQPVLALENGLPFTWCCIPKAIWDQVAEDHFSNILALLTDRGASGLQLAGSAVSSVRRAISGWEPELAPLLDLAPQTAKLAEIAQSFVQRAHDRALGFGDSPFRGDMSARLPDWPFMPDFYRALDAPCAAALSAKGLVRLSELQMRCVKDVARRHPRYFLEAYAAFFKELSVV